MNTSYYEPPAGPPEHFYTWCESEDREPDEDAYEEYMERLEQAREDYLIEQAEARAEEGYYDDDFS